MSRNEGFPVKNGRNLTAMERIQKVSHRRLLSMRHEFRNEYEDECQRRRVVKDPGEKTLTMGLGKK